MATELVQLRSFYASPGFLLLARENGEPVGCIGVRALDISRGEIRRLFVRPEHRSGGLGRRLLDRASDLARDRGFRQLVLTTLPTMTAARALYDEDGFEPIEPYIAHPVDGVQFLARLLRPRRHGADAVL
ncbi:MAG: GNAT family N-acetyltransferase [Micrococcales bacterium]|nr:GNAT family N-acetyltransferase [Micrococcales bacterium]